jgi:DNA repair protein RecN (Recombination protein N)
LREAEDASAEHAIARALTVARGLTEFDARYGDIARAIEESLIALREGVEAVERYESSLDADPNRQEWVEQRLAAVESVARKHRIEPAAIHRLQEDLQAEFDRLESLEASIEKVQQALGEVERIFRDACSRLSAARDAAARKLSERISTLMQTLGMPGGVFQIATRPLEQHAAGPHGADDIEFLVSANPGQPPKSLAKVASGGELSRISLAIQVASVQEESLPCLVFDEVDAGVGGGVAEIVGRQLRALGQRTQVLCVTHLPQVASQAHAHVRVSKLTDRKITRTTLHTLTQDERIEEIARMLGGIDITSKAREHAAEMLRSGSTQKKKATRK